MNTVGCTRSRYICYIKLTPENIQKETGISYSINQSRCMGVLAAVTLSRIAFPNSLYHEKMIERFSSLTTIIIVEKKQKIIYIISITAASLSEYISVK